MPFGAGLRGAMLRAFLPTQLTGCVLWLRADLGVTSSTTFTWADQSGTGDVNKNCTATGTARPTANASNGSYANAPTIDFNGTTNHLQSGTWASALAQPFSLLIVGHTHSQTTANPSYALSRIDSTVTGVNAQPTSMAPTVIESAGGNVSSSGSWSSPGVFGYTTTGGNVVDYFNSHTSTGSGPTGTTGFNGFTVGDYGGSLATGFQWGQNGGGSIAEVIAYNRALSGSEITQVMQYLGARYGITIS